MFKSLFNITIRSIKKRMFYSVLNILGLALSIAFAFLLWLYVRDQKSYDQHYPNAERIYRVNADFNMNGKRDIYSNAPRPIGPALKNDYPEVEVAARLYGAGGLEVHTGILEFEQKRVKTKEMFIADSTVFKIFHKEFIQGNPDKALTEPNSIVISESLAAKLFDTKEDAFEKSLVMQSRRGPLTLKVTGIIKDEKRNSHLPMEAITSWIPSQSDISQWYGAHVNTYILLNKNNDIKSLKDKIPTFFETHMKKTFEELNGKADLIFQPLTEVYLDPEYVWEPNPHGSNTNLKALNIVIVFLLIFACINYINLATARAAERAAEVGIRKTLGSPRWFLIAQFLIESITLSLLSGLLALMLCVALLPYFNLLGGLNLGVATLLSFKHIFYVMMLSIMIGLSAGLYPAFYLSSLESLTVLKGTFARSSKGEFMRKLLVTSQYFIAAILIASILFVAEQTTFIKNKDIGYDKSNLLVITIPPDTVVSRHMSPFIDEIRKSPRVAGVTNSLYALDKEANQFTPTFQNEDGSTFSMGADLIVIDADFIDALGIKIISGRNFIRDSQADMDESFIINETAVEKLGWKKNPLGGKMVNTDAKGNVNKINVVGVVKDFNLGTSYQSIHPLIIFFTNRSGSTLYVRLTGDETLTTVNELKEVWAKIFPGREFEFNFLDQSLNRLYEKEEKFLNLLTVFSFIIVFIASLGIIGLISFTTELKKKEIAVRKVLGSPSKAIIWLLSKNFGSMLLLANVVALPVTYYLINLWLTNFTHHIEPGAWPFILSFFVCFIFTAISVGYHTIQAISANPVEALNYE
jgi:putative ABC transport system permease protein